MAWDSNWPVGTISVKANKPQGVANMQYIENTIGNAAVGVNLTTTTDHFFDVSATLDGHHRFIKMPRFTSTEIAPNDVDPQLSTDIDSILYPKLKTAIESTVQQDVQPFYKNLDASNAIQIMQILGIRAMGVFNGSSSTPAQASVVYSHNLATQTAGTKGIVRDAEGRYTVNFASPMPSANYLVFGGAIRNKSSLTADELLFVVSAGPTLATMKTTTFFKFSTLSGSSAVHDPLQAWFMVFGG